MNIPELFLIGSRDTSCRPDVLPCSDAARAHGHGPGRHDGEYSGRGKTFALRGPWEADRGPQRPAYDFWWHLGQDTMISSAWGTPNMVEAGVNPELRLGGKYGHALHVWDLRRRTHLQTLDLGAE